MMNRVLIVAFLLSSAVLQAQQPSHPAKPATAPASDSSILVGESANLKSDLAQLRSMLNVLASQQSGMDPRSFSAMQTNRQMWQVVIARLAELTQRIDALEKERSGKAH